MSNTLLWYEVLDGTPLNPYLWCFPLNTKGYSLHTICHPIKLEKEHSSLHSSEHVGIKFKYFSKIFLVN